MERTGNRSMDAVCKYKRLYDDQLRYVSDLLQPSSEKVSRVYGYFVKSPETADGGD